MIGGVLVKYNEKEDECGEGGGNNEPAKKLIDFQEKHKLMNLKISWKKEG